MAKGGPETKRRIPPDPKINLWYQLPDSEALVEAVGNLNKRDIRLNPELRGFVRNRINDYEEGGHITPKKALELEDHINSLKKS